MAPVTAQIDNGRPRIRPQFTFEVRLPRDDVIERLRDGLEAKRWPLSGAVSSEHVDVRMNEERRHTWSPWLTLWVEEQDAGSRVRGRFGPHPDIWTLYLGLYAAVILVSGAIGLYGVAQWMIDQSAWGLWALPAGCLGVLLVWASAFVGQGLSTEQTMIMRAFVVDSVGDAAGGMATVGPALSLPPEVQAADLNAADAAAEVLARWQQASRPAAGNAARHVLPRRRPKG